MESRNGIKETIGGIYMETMQSFLMFFYILDQCYMNCRENDLGGFLGTISPELWTDGKPIDIAIYNDWQKISNPETINEENIIKKTYDFLVHYEKTFGYEFSKTKEWLITSNEQNVIENAKLCTKKLYQEYNFDG